MSLVFLTPLGWLALAALGVPILIHLIRRRHTRRTPFAALQWIAMQRSTRRQLNIKRWLLLMLRLLLLALLAALLATPVWQTMRTGDASHWVVVAPGVDANVAREAVHTSRLAAVEQDASSGLGDATDPSVEWRWLAPGFPTLDSALPSATIATASLLRELDAELPSSVRLSVVVPQKVSGLDGERPRFTRLAARQFDWITVAGRMPIIASSDAIPALHVLVRHADDQTASLRYLRAMEGAWPAHTVTIQWQSTSETRPIADDIDWLIWLGAEPTPQVEDWITAGGNALLINDHPATTHALWRADDGQVLASMQRQAAGRRLSLAGALLPRDLPLLLDADFPERLLGILRGPTSSPRVASASALRPHLPESSSAESNIGSASSNPDRNRPLDGWLTLLVGLVFLAERIIATRRSPEPA